MSVDGLVVVGGKDFSRWKFVSFAIKFSRMRRLLTVTRGLYLVCGIWERHGCTEMCVVKCRRKSTGRKKNKEKRIYVKEFGAKLNHCRQNLERMPAMMIEN